MSMGCLVIARPRGEAAVWTEVLTFRYAPEHQEYAGWRRLPVPEAAAWTEVLTFRYAPEHQEYAGWRRRKPQSVL
jgi:hypothetical protein